MKARLYRYHLMALFCSILWGTTFVSTKVLINHGLMPTEIFFYRFVLAYIGIWLISPRQLWANCWKDELILIGAGLTGGSLYFLAENTALEITLASNVSLIVCTTPILTALLFRCFSHSERLSHRYIWGSLTALIGVALVVFNGSFILQISPVGDLLTLLAALCWAFYCLLLKGLGDRYSTVFITRKVFFYGLISILPFLYGHSNVWNLGRLLQPILMGNLLFLGLIASLLCFVLWNDAVQRLGALRTTNYIYINPLTTLITSALIINEQITPIALLGCILILSGIYIAEKS